MMLDARLEDAINKAKLDAKGQVPDAETLATAPLLEHWYVDSVAPGVFRLKGVVSGHPRIGDGWCTTGPVVAVADDRAWVKTLSRYYRLGVALLERID